MIIHVDLCQEASVSLVTTCRSPNGEVEGRKRRRLRGTDCEVTPEEALWLKQRALTLKLIKEMTNVVALSLIEGSAKRHSPPIELRRKPTGGDQRRILQHL